MLYSKLSYTNLGSSANLPAHCEGGARARFHNVAAKISVHPRKNTAEWGCGGNSAVFLQKVEASPAALQVIAKHHRKILFSLGEKEIRRAQNEKSKEYFSVVRRALGSGGGAASLVGVRLVKSSDFVQEGQGAGSEPDRFSGVNFGRLQGAMSAV